MSNYSFDENNLLLIKKKHTYTFKHEGGSTLGVLYKDQQVIKSLKYYHIFGNILFLITNNKHA